MEEPETTNGSAMKGRIMSHTSTKAVKNTFAKSHINMAIDFTVVVTSVSASVCSPEIFGGWFCVSTKMLLSMRKKNASA
jgi:hypothetical protein